MVESILRDEHRILPVCAYLNGEYNVKGYYMGVPAILGFSGVEKIVELLLNEEENEAFSSSANDVKQLVSDMIKLNLI
jgi:malate dehydrogenase